MDQRKYGNGGIRTHASEETGALNQRLRPLGHATTERLIFNSVLYDYKNESQNYGDKENMAAVGFETTPPKRQVPKTSA